MTSLDIVMPTYNRAASLRRAVESLSACRRPPELSVRILVVDNNSTDATQATLASLAETASLPVLALAESRQGQPAAINAVLAVADADLIGFFDDDERAFPDWLEVIAAAFEDPGLGFISGRYVPDWLAPKPDWLPPRRLGLVGVVDHGEVPIPLTAFTDGLNFLGGNSVARRDLVRAAEGYSEWLTYGNDAEFGVRLMAAGARGRYEPALRVHHEIPAGRLTRSYLRRRTMLNYAAKIPIRQRWPGIDDMALGFPYRLAYYRLRAAASGAWQALRDIRDPAARFEAELNLWDLLGLLRGWVGLGRSGLMR